MYQRRFDHEQAQARHTAGESYSSIARDLGVSVDAVRRVCDPRVKVSMEAASLAWHRRRRELCRGGCGRLVWVSTRRDATGFCPGCLQRERCESARLGELRCARCHEWKPDDEFPRRRETKTRRGRHGLCRRCQTAARRDYRERHKQPCETCGAPALPPNEKGSRGTNRLRCRRCYRAAVRQETA